MAGIAEQEKGFGDLPDVGFSQLIAADSVTTFGQGGGGQQQQFAQSQGLQDFRAEMESLKAAAEAAKKIVAAASWTEQACTPAPAGGAILVPDPGVTVVLPGTKPGESTVLPPHMPAQPAPGTPDKPGAGTSEPIQNTGRILFADGPFVSTYSLTPLTVPIYGPKEEVEDKLVLLPFGGSPLIAVANLAGADKCCTFGNNPRVIVNPPTKISLARAVLIPPVEVRIAFEFSLTPIEANFGRTGLCWQGICETPAHEILVGTVFAIMSIKLTISVTAPIKIGRVYITARIFLQDALSVPRHASYTLQCGQQGQ